MKSGGVAATNDCKSLFRMLEMKPEILNYQDGFGSMLRMEALPRT